MLVQEVVVCLEKKVVASCALLLVVFAKPAESLLRNTRGRELERLFFSGLNKETLFYYIACSVLLLQLTSILLLSLQALCTCFLN